MAEKTRVARPRIRTAWVIVRHELARFVLITFGAVLVAFGYTLFQVPHNITAGGLGGISIIVNSFSGWPVGLMFWVMSIPMLILGFVYLGRWRFLLRTLYASTIFSVFTDWFIVMLPSMIAPFPLTGDLLLNALYGGILGGIGGGLIFRAGSTMGGTGIIGRILQYKTGLPLSQTYFFTNGVVILTAGVVFGWEIALYGFLMLFVNGLAADYTLEGPSTTRTATIITDHPKRMSAALMHTLHHGVSYWQITGGYTGQQRYMVMCTLYRPRVNEVKRIVAEVDSRAFVTIGISHQALGKGFKRLRQGE